MMSVLFFKFMLNFFHEKNFNYFFIVIVILLPER